MINCFITLRADISSFSTLWVTGGTLVGFLNFLTEESERERKWDKKKSSSSDADEWDSIHANDDDVNNNGDERRR